MDSRLLSELNRERQARRAVILVSSLDGGESRIVREGDAIQGALGEAAAAAFRSGRSATIEIGGRNVFLNVHLPPPRLVVIGAVHISQALAPMAALVGFDTEIIDPRTAFATPERFAGISLHAEWPQDVLVERPLDRYTALAALTHDPKIDDHPLVAALESGCFYVGALGSRKTHAKRVERLTTEGVPSHLLERIRAPIGLPIGAASPPEIAVAVLAEVVQALRTRETSAAKQDEPA